MNRKFLTLLITGVISLTSLTPAYANTLELKHKQELKSEATTMDEAIKTVEKDYLIQNSDGTFTIDDSAKNIIGEDIYSKLKIGVNKVNSLIHQDMLKFNTSGEVISNNYNPENIIRTRTTDAYSQVLSSYDYCSNYEWHWWGFKTKVNKEGSDILLAEFPKTIAQVALAGASVAWIPGFAIPTGLVGGAIEVWLVSLQSECDKGAKGNGINVTALGAPSSPQITDIDAIY